MVTQMGKKIVKPLRWLLSPINYKYNQMRLQAAYNRMDVVQHSPFDNIYYCCTQRTASQWFRRIFRDPIVYKYSGLSILPYRELGLNQAVFTEPFAKQTICSHIYVGYPTYLTIPKPEKYRTFFVMRDPRDIAVSWYFAAKYSHRPVDPIPELRNDLKSLSLADGLKYSIDSLEKFGLFAAQRSWMNISEDKENIKLFRYEDFAEDNYLFLTQLLNYLSINIPEAELNKLYEENKFTKITKGRSQGTEDQNDHYRKGISGDWQNYFDAPLDAYFKQVTGNLLTVLGYDS